MQVIDWSSTKLQHCCKLLLYILTAIMQKQNGQDFSIEARRTAKTRQTSLLMSGSHIRPSWFVAERKRAHQQQHSRKKIWEIFANMQFCIQMCKARSAALWLALWPRKARTTEQVSLAAKSCLRLKRVVDNFKLYLCHKNTSQCQALSLFYMPDYVDVDC